MLVEVRVRVRKGLQVEAPLHLLDLEDQQVEVSHPEDRWDDLRHRLGCLRLSTGGRCSTRGHDRYYPSF